MSDAYAVPPEPVVARFRLASRVHSGRFCRNSTHWPSSPFRDRSRCSIRPQVARACPSSSRVYASITRPTLSVSTRSPHPCTSSSRSAEHSDIPSHTETFRVPSEPFVPVAFRCDVSDRSTCSSFVHDPSANPISVHRHTFATRRISRRSAGQRASTDTSLGPSRGSRSSCSRQKPDGSSTNPGSSIAVSENLRDCRSSNANTPSLRSRSVHPAAATASKWNSCGASGRIRAMRAAIPFDAIASIAVCRPVCGVRTFRRSSFSSKCVLMLVWSTT